MIPSAKNATMRLKAVILPITLTYSEMVKSLNPAMKLFYKNITALTKRISQVYHRIAFPKVQR
jgi:hypothetical protein